jgi:hypothetical protein
MVWIIGIRLECEKNFPRGSESRDVVDVAVRIVADTAFTQPDGVRDAQIFLECLLVFLASQLRISNLRVTEEPLLGDEHRSRSIRLDPAAFEHHPRSVIRTFCHRSLEPGDFLYSVTDFLVTLVILVLCPSVEAPVHELDFAAGISNERRR